MGVKLFKTHLFQIAFFQWPSQGYSYRSIFNQSFLWMRPVRITEAKTLSHFQDTVWLLKLKLPYIGGVLCELVIEKSYRSCICTLFLHQKVEIDVIFSLRTADSEIRADFFF